MQQNDSDELLTSKELEEFLTSELTIIDQELTAENMNHGKQTAMLAE